MTSKVSTLKPNARGSGPSRQSAVVMSEDVKGNSDNVSNRVSWVVTATRSTHSNSGAMKEDVSAVSGRELSPAGRCWSYDGPSAMERAIVASCYRANLRVCLVLTLYSLM